MLNHIGFAPMPSSAYLLSYTEHNRPLLLYQQRRDTQSIWYTTSVKARRLYLPPVITNHTHRAISCWIQPTKWQQSISFVPIKDTHVLCASFFIPLRNLLCARHSTSTCLLKGHCFTLHAHFTPSELLVAVSSLQLSTSFETLPVFTARSSR